MFCRISSSSNKYQVIKPPFDFLEDNYSELYLGRSGKGVCCAAAYGRSLFKVWFLDESCVRMEWVLKYDVDLTGWLLKHKLEPRRQIHGPWTLQDTNFHYDNKHRDENKSIQVSSQETFEGDSDDEKTECSSSSANGDVGHYRDRIDVFGFHPHKKIIFLSKQITRGLACHLNSSKAQDLGCICPTRYDNDYMHNEQGVKQSFPYTPCWTMGPSTEEKKNLEEHANG
jgi:hypothetical protein